jgi:hypothetical protein
VAYDPWRPDKTAGCAGGPGPVADEVVEGLERQRFSVRESEEVFEELVAKYASGLFHSGRSAISVGRRTGDAKR